MRILGIDPGLQITGYGCIEGDPMRPSIVEAGVFRLKPIGDADSAESISARLVELERDTKDLLERVQPEAVAVESMFVNPKFPATVIKMAQGRGVVLLCIKRFGAPLIELKPAEVKKGMTGNGQASKEQMQEAVQRFFGLEDPPKPHDVADGLAIAVIAAQRGLTPRTPLQA